MSEKQENNHLEALRHSAEHVLQEAMQKLYPEIKMAMGPAIETGFYFDFELPNSKISESDFPKIEAEMQKIINSNLPISQKLLPLKEAASSLFKNNEYKKEWLKQLEEKKEEKVSLYYTGCDFFDLCKGPHAKTTGEIKAFKLLSVAGAYWHGDEKNKMLTRIYGTAFENQKDLDKFLWQKEEAQKRDHKKIGKELELFMFDDEIGPGLPLYMPKGAMLRKLIMEFAFNTYLEKGYQPVSTPHIGKVTLWEKSGHWHFYRESMYSPMKIDKEQYVLKPMNCPAHVKIYQFKNHSYRELPIRLAEMGTVYRYEKSGELNGILRPRGFTQDDAHIICTPEQLNEELLAMIDLTKYIYSKFGFHDPTINLSIRDPQNKKKYLGEDKKWNQAEKALENALKVKDLPYQKIEGEAAFYGPKIDFMYEDAIGRKQQLTTIQVDFNLPKKFNMTYIDKDGKEKQPFMLHRALLGSLERFMGVLIEHTAGTFPVWLSPLQVVIIPISENHATYAQEIAQELQENQIRAEINDRNETMQQKIRLAQNQKIPYMIILGDREVKDHQISLRCRSGKQKNNLDLKEFIQDVLAEIRDKKNSS